MKATIGLEYFGENEDSRLNLYTGIMNQSAPGLGNTVLGKMPSRKPWVAAITGLDERFGFSREFLSGKMQRKRSNASGSRGVELWFVLESDRVYEVVYFVSWRSKERYFCCVSESGEINKITKQDVQKWLNDH